MASGLLFTRHTPSIVAHSHAEPSAISVALVGSHGALAAKALALGTATGVAVHLWRNSRRQVASTRPLAGEKASMVATRMAERGGNASMTSLQERILQTAPWAGLFASLIWAGEMLAVPFLEAWVKFQAPSVTRAIGLDVGRHVFSALNKLELWQAAALSAGWLLPAGAAAAAAALRCSHSASTATAMTSTPSPAAGALSPPVPAAATAVGPSAASAASGLTTALRLFPELAAVFALLGLETAVVLPGLLDRAAAHIAGLPPPGPGWLHKAAAVVITAKLALLLTSALRCKGYILDASCHSHMGVPAAE